MAKAYARKYKKYYTNILYIEYTGDLHPSVTEMDFTDDMPGINEEKRFQNHLRVDTMLLQISCSKMNSFQKGVWKLKLPYIQTIDKFLLLQGFVYSLKGL